MSLLLLAAWVTAATLRAQPGGFQRRTVEERIKTTGLGTSKQGQLLPGHDKVVPVWILLPE